MKISKKAEYALKAVIEIANHNQSKPLQINDISKKRSIPVKFLEQILLTLKKNNILVSKRGANGGYLLSKKSSDISIRVILEAIDGPFEPIGLSPSNSLGNGLEECFREMIKMVNLHLNSYTIQDVVELDKNEDFIAFGI